MINALKEIYQKIHGNNAIDLKKIVRQRSSSYKKISISEINCNDYLKELEDYHLIKVLSDEELIILPLGYAVVLSDKHTFSANDEFELLRKIYLEQCDQIMEPLISDNFSNVDCALGMFILLTGNTSSTKSFQFIKDKSTKDTETYEFYDIIKEGINYILFRLFYALEIPLYMLDDPIELRNRLGRNDKNGNIKKRTSLFNVITDRGAGVKYMWFDIDEIDTDTYAILENILKECDNLISLLNLKKIAMDNLLINNLPYDIQTKLGDRPERSLILNEVIKYADRRIEKYIEGKEPTMSVEEKIKVLSDLKFDPLGKYEYLKEIFDIITKIINEEPKLGIFLIEIHYRLAWVKYMYEVIDKNKEHVLQNYINELGDDFEELFEENIELCISSIN